MTSEASKGSNAGFVVRHATMLSDLRESAFLYRTEWRQVPQSRVLPAFRELFDGDHPSFLGGLSIWDVLETSVKKGRDTASEQVFLRAALVRHTVASEERSAWQRQYLSNKYDWDDQDIKYRAKESKVDDYRSRKTQIDSRSAIRLANRTRARLERKGYPNSPAHRESFHDFERPRLLRLEAEFVEAMSEVARKSSQLSQWIADNPQSVETALSGHDSCEGEFRASIEAINTDLRANLEIITKQGEAELTDLDRLLSVELEILQQDRVRRVEQASAESEANRRVIETKVARSLQDIEAEKAGSLKRLRAKHRQELDWLEQSVQLCGELAAADARERLRQQHQDAEEKTEVLFSGKSQYVTNSVQANLQAEVRALEAALSKIAELGDREISELTVAFESRKNERRNSTTNGIAEATRRKQQHEDTQRALFKDKVASLLGQGTLREIIPAWIAS